MFLEISGKKTNLGCSCVIETPKIAKAIVQPFCKDLDDLDEACWKGFTYTACFFGKWVALRTCMYMY